MERFTQLPRRHLTPTLPRHCVLLSQNHFARFPSNRFALFLSSRFTLILAIYICSHKAIAQPPRLSSLKETFKTDFLIGTAMNARQIKQTDSLADRLIIQQFNAVTPENIMKAAIIHPGWDTYNYGLADQLVAYAQKNKIRINAHTLIWHSQLPSFMQKINSPDSVRRYFTSHIKTLASRYDGKVYSWDVVNEALNEDGTLRNSIFRQKLGDEYITEAFRLAQKAAPHTRLYYNDYNIEQPGKRAGAIALVKRIQAAGVRIDGIGIQGHWRAANVPLQDIEESIQQFAALGVEVMFTEMDLSVLPNPWDNNTADVSLKTADTPNAGLKTASAGQKTANAGREATGTTNTGRMNPYPHGLPDSIGQIQARAYADLFRLFLKYKKNISRITFWGVNDSQSWLNDWPIPGRTNYPLLFDRNYKPKPSFDSVMATAISPSGTLKK